MVTLTNLQARQFLLLKHGLLNGHRFIGKQGILDFTRQAGCLQFDPIDVCGKNAELVLQSRVKNFTKEMLHDVLYKDRLLIDYPDKNIAIIPVEDWPYFERYRQTSREHGQNYPEMQALSEQVHHYISEHGPVSSDAIHLDGDFYWRSAIHWSGGNNLSRSVLEQMYSTGELIIHHKKGARKFYDLAEKYISPDLLQAPEPLPGPLEHCKWRVLRRIGAVGLLWNRPSDAWLNIWGMKSELRNEVFLQLLKEEKISEVTVEGVKYTLYCRAEDLELAEYVLQNHDLKPRCELIAPLDNFLWDRRLIQALFHFDYTWEIYTPAAKRKYGYYVLPLLYGDRLIGRVEAVADRKTDTLFVKNIWYENDLKPNKRIQTSVNKCITRFARFNQCHNMIHTLP